MTQHQLSCLVELNRLADQLCHLSPVFGIDIIFLLVAAAVDVAVEQLEVPPLAEGYGHCGVAVGVVGAAALAVGVFVEEPLDAPPPLEAFLPTRVLFVAVGAPVGGGGEAGFGGFDTQPTYRRPGS